MKNPEVDVNGLFLIKAELFKHGWLMGLNHKVSNTGHYFRVLGLLLRTDSNWFIEPLQLAKTTS